MKFKPLGARILVEDIPEKYEGKIALSPLSKEKPTGTGVVLAIGPDVKNVAVEDVIFIGQYIGQIIILEGKPYRVMQAIDVLGKMEE